jgi:ADP-heptose:LPS heptosyltransferase
MHLPFVRRILLCVRYGIGDLVMETPVITSLRQQLPRAQIIALGAHPALELLENDPAVDALASVQDWGLNHWGDAGNGKVRQTIADWLVQERFDVIIDPSHAVMAVGETIWESAATILDTCNDAQEKVLREGRGGVAAIKAAVQSGWGLHVQAELNPRIHIDAEDEELADRFLLRHGLADRSPIGISPVASSPLKRWPVERQAAAADWIIECSGRSLLLFCGAQREIAASLLSAMRHRDKVVTVGRLHLRRIAALLARCSSFLCNDTGLMHIASAVGTPAIAVFGPTSPAIYLPVETASTAVCGNVPCPHRLTTTFGPPSCIIAGRCLVREESCITSVSTNQVMSALSGYLDSEKCRGSVDSGPSRQARFP